MSPEKCRNNFERRFDIQSTDQAQNFQFILEREAVARFHFDRRCAAFQKPIGMFLRLFEKFFFARGPRFLDCGPNSAAGFGDLLVRVAARAAFKIIEAISTENQMRVRINESRQGNASAKINNLDVARAVRNLNAFCIQVLFDLVAWTDDVDLSVANQDSAVPNNSELG